MQIILHFHSVVSLLRAAGTLITPIVSNATCNAFTYVFIYLIIAITIIGLAKRSSSNNNSLWLPFRNEPSQVKLGFAISIVSCDDQLINFAVRWSWLEHPLIQPFNCDLVRLTRDHHKWLALNSILVWIWLSLFCRLYIPCSAISINRIFLLMNVRIVSSTVAIIIDLSKDTVWKQRKIITILLYFQFVWFFSYTFVKYSTL